MMKTKKILTLALLPIIGMLTACSNEDAQLTDERVPITLTGTTLTLTETRTSANTDLNSDYMEADRAVKVRIRNTNSTGDWSNYAYTSGTNGVLTPPSLPPFYPLDNTNVDIVAYSPYDAGNTFTVRADQTSNDAYLASDLVFASKSNQEKSSTAVPLQFEHKMAKVVVNVTAGSASGVSEIRSVTLQNVKRQVTFNEINGTVSNAVTSGATTVAVAKDGTTTSVIGAVIIPAQTIEGQLLTVVTDIGTATYTVDSKEFNAGKVYMLTIQVGRTAIDATTEITGWTDTEGAIVGSANSTGSPFLTFTVGSVTFEMVFVEGTDDNIAMTWGNHNATTPASPINKSITINGLSDYYIGQTEVTNGLWNAVMGSKPTGQTNNGNKYPVHQITWNEICTATTGFLDRLNTALADQLPLGMQFKLPSEAQWQFAAMGGKHSKGYTYAGSMTLSDVAWYSATSNNTTHEVATKPANELGLYDMSGNLWEYCLDYYAEVSKDQVLPKDYVNTTAASNRVMRGGAIGADPVRCTVSVRNICPPNETGNRGFRLVLQ
jgi:formylglycine-generating enzyme required for sulfatase activity